MKNLFLLSLIVLYFAYAQENYSHKVSQVSQKKIWLSLLHYDKSLQKSSILNKDFFLSKVGNIDPRKELLATISAYQENNQTLICKFPARFYWLSKVFNWRDYTQKNSHCRGYKEWELIKNTTSLSAVFVSGFLGNPASAFGHSFFKINKDSKNNLLDSTISYGAKLPKKYTMLSYIYNGLLGGYTASYTDKYYYMDDMIYSNREFREMWEYELNLSEKEKKLFFLHLWELQKINFQYYFLNRNCGYKISELLEVILSEDIIEDANIWYLPIQTFYKLDNYPSKIAKITYHPSAQQKIYSFYHQLNSIEKKRVTQRIKNPQKQYRYDKESTQRSKIKVLDFLLDFYSYKIQGYDEGSLNYTEIKKAKYTILFERLKLPISSYTKKLILTKRPITENDKPRIIEVNIIKHRNQQKSLELVYSLFSLEDIGYNTYSGDLFTVLKTHIKIDEKHISLSKIDFIKMRRLKTKQLSFDRESPWSWSLHLGMLKEIDRDYFASVGIGYTWDLLEKYKFYSMINVSLHSRNQHKRVYPHIGLFADFNYLKLNLEYGKENIYTEKIEDEKIELRLQYKLSKTNALALAFTKNEQEHISVGIKWFF